MKIIVLLYAVLIFIDVISLQKIGSKTKIKISHNFNVNRPA